MKVKLIHPDLDASISVPPGSVPGLAQSGWVRVVPEPVTRPRPRTVVAAPIAPAEPGDATEGIPPTNSQEG